MKKNPVLWFMSLCMTTAFIGVAFLHQTREEALIAGVVSGVTAAIMEALLKPLWRRVVPLRYCHD